MVAQAGRIGRQNSKKAICTTGWKNGNAKSIFEIFSPTSPNGIYSYYNIKDIPIYNSPLSAYVTIICGFNWFVFFQVFDERIWECGNRNCQNFPRR